MLPSLFRCDLVLLIFATISFGHADIQHYWISSLSRAEQIKYWENYLASPTNDDAETRADMPHLLDYLRAVQNQPRHACHLMDHVPSTATNPQRILIDPIHLRGYAPALAVNGKKGKLLLDTGASGILRNPGICDARPVGSSD